MSRSAICFGLVACVLASSPPVAAAATSTRYDGKWVGTMSNGEAIEFVIADGCLARVSYAVVMGGDGQKAHRVDEELEAPAALLRGRVKTVETGTLHDIRFKGRKSARGKLVLSPFYHDGDAKQRTLTWEAARAPDADEGKEESGEKETTPTTDDVKETGKKAQPTDEEEVEDTTPRPTTRAAEQKPKPADAEKTDTDEPDTDVRDDAKTPRAKTSGKVADKTKSTPEPADAKADTPEKTQAKGEGGKSDVEKTDGTAEPPEAETAAEKTPPAKPVSVPPELKEKLQLGQTKDEVQELLGPPRWQIGFSGRETLGYDAVKIKLREGKVANIEWLSATEPAGAQDDTTGE